MMAWWRLGACISVVGILLLIQVYLGGFQEAMAPSAYPHTGGKVRVFSHSSASNLNKTLKAPEDEILKKLGTSTIRAQVLIVAYMRGGSSLVGELFNRFNGALYWFEAVDGIYSATYGTRYGWTPLDISHNLQGEPWSKNEFDEGQLVEELTKIFTCNLSALSTEVLTHRYVSPVFSKQTETYSKCLHKVMTSQKLTSSNDVTYMSSENCKVILQSVCPQTLDDVRALKCRSILNMTYSERVKYLESAECNEATKWRFTEYFKCMDNIREAAEICLPELQQQCDQASVIAVKSIRVPLSIVPLLMQNIPDLKVIHVLREPYKIVLSRKRLQLMSSASDGDVIMETQLLCYKITRDLKQFASLRKQYPHSFLPIYLNKSLQRSNLSRMAIHIFRDFLKLKNITPNLYRGDLKNNITLGRGCWACENETKPPIVQLSQSFIRDLKKACLNFYRATGYGKLYMNDKY